MKKLLFILSLLVMSGHLYAGTVSFDQLSVSGDLTTTKFNTDLNTIYQDHNNNVQTGNILDDTITEADFADEANPRIRTYEGASCEKVDDGLLNTTTSGTLSGAIPTGTAYPRGFRCDKTSTTARTWTASRWTFLDIDQDCNFQFSEVAIAGATPSVAANSIRISRVSTDGTQVFAVQDLRTTNCSAGTFDGISDATGEATLEDMFTYGTPVRNRGTGGFAQGAYVSYDAATTFLVTPGAAYINGKFRRNTSNTSVPQTADDPSVGTSGIDTGSIAGSTRYNVFAVADQDATATFSVSFGTGATPNGITNYRKIGEVFTDSGTTFTSTDIVQTHGIQQRELASAWINFNGAGTVATLNSYNVSGLTDNATGDYTVTWNQDFRNANYAVVYGVAQEDSNTALSVNNPHDFTEVAGSVRMEAVDSGGAGDPTNVSVVAFGEQ